MAWPHHPTSREQYRRRPTSHRSHQTDLCSKLLQTSVAEVLCFPRTYLGSLIGGCPGYSSTRSAEIAPASGSLAIFNSQRSLSVCSSLSSTNFTPNPLPAV